MLRWSNFILGYTHIKGQEYLYIIPDGGPVQFIRGDRPQEFFGTEVCLVRNHRFEGFYFLRTNGIVQSSILDIITANIIRECTIEIRNRVYIETQQFLNERVVGINCGMFVEYIGFPYSISFSMKGLEIYNKAMLVFSSPSTMDIARTSFDNPAHLDCLAAELVLEESSSL